MEFSWIIRYNIKKHFTDIFNKIVILIQERACEGQQHL